MHSISNQKLNGGDNSIWELKSASMSMEHVNGLLDSMKNHKIGSDRRVYVLFKNLTPIFLLIH